MVAETAELSLINSLNMEGIFGKFPSWMSLSLFWCNMFWWAGATHFELYSAHITLNYTAPKSGKVTRELAAVGRYGVASPVEMEVGNVVHVMTEDSANHGCTPAMNVPSGSRWIALVQRGNCKFEQKITAAVEHNASAVVIYNHKKTLS